jgi:hypothetical protein
MPGDVVTYCGESLRQELGGKMGFIHAPVLNADNVYVVFFPDTKEQDSYVINESNLRRYIVNDKANGPVIAPRRRRHDEDEESKGK